MNQQQHDEALTRFREEVASGHALYLHWQSHASRRLGGPPVARAAWADCIEWLAKLARQSDATAQVVRYIGLPPLYQTAGEAAAYVYKAAWEAMGRAYDDVIGRSGPEAGRPSSHVRGWTLRERILVLAYLKLATARLDTGALGYGWALIELAAAEGVTLPTWQA